MTLTSLQRLIAFDFGLRRIGVAYGQMVTKTAKPVTTLLANDGHVDPQTISALLNEYEPQALIVGLPLNMDGTDQAITQDARQFAAWLSKAFKLPVHLSDERLTTIEARDQIFSQGGAKALNKKQIDAYAAVIILESWMRDNH